MFLMKGLRTISEATLLLAAYEKFNLWSLRFSQIWEGWSTIASLCFWNGLFAFIHLIFIVTILIHYLLEKIREKSVCLKTLECKNTHGNTKFSKTSSSLAYQATKVCCLTVLTCHILKITFLILQCYQTDCGYQLTVMSEALQSFSWVLLLVVTFKFQHLKCIQIPPTIRAWWTCTFFQAIIFLSFDIHRIFLEKVSIGVHEYIDIAIIFSSTYLFTTSIKGKTGITLVQNVMIEPLLPGLVEESRKNKKVSLYGNANLIQLVTFSWMSPLIAKGYKKPLESEDVPELYEKDASEFVSSSFANILNSVKERQGLNNTAVYKAIFIFARKKVIINACFAVASASASYVGPSLINQLVSFLDGKRKNGVTEGYVLAIAILTAKILEARFEMQWIFGARQLAMCVRATLISHIYQKGLRLSSRSKQTHTSGEIINYMSVDIQRISDVVWYANIVWMLPVQLSLAIFILHQNLGKGAFAGLAATLAVMAINIPLTCILKRLQIKIMASKDARMKATSEVLKGMRILKLQAWDTQYLKKLEELRGVEYGWLWRKVRIGILTCFVFWSAPAYISVITFGSCILMGIHLTAGRVLSTLATLKMLQEPIFNLPDLLSVLTQGKVSSDRIVSYLQEEEIYPNAVEIMSKDDSDYEIEIMDGVFNWEAESKAPTLMEIQLKVCKGMKVAICGAVGSGKSSLLSCILGEIPKLSGVVRVRGTKAYVPQIPWILSGNVRENILFGKSYEREKYENIIEACALRKDLELFPNGDLTEIGERGINLSGGQKQRIQIARAAYHDADMYILDDPFSAVDAHTGSQLFKDCLVGILKEKTILYVTHQVEFLPAADLIIVMQDGRIAQAGKFQDLMRQNIGFEALVGAHSQALESILYAESSSRLSSISPDCNNKNTIDQFETIIKHESQHDLSQDSTQKGRLTQEEEREKGAVGKKVYWTYLTAVKGGALIPAIILTQLLFQLFQVASNYWIAWASPTTTAAQPVVGIGMLFFVYTLISFLSSLCMPARGMFISMVALPTSQKLFKKMLHCIFRAPMLFFDSTPTGRILNRASNDQSVLDMEIMSKLGWTAFTILQIMATIGVMSQIAWPVFAIFVPVTTICFWYQRYYIPTARELVRLSEIQRAPILHHFAESLTGATTIRAFDQEEQFSKSNLSCINSYSKPWFHNISAMEWLSFRLNLLSNFIFAFSVLLLVSLPEGFIDPSIAGLAVTYALNLNSQLSTIIWNICNTENKMISVERILQYCHIPSEAPLLIEDCQPPNNWPEKGTIHIKDLEVRYAEHLPSVLRGVTCEVPGRKKVGVVGRTGSGKSTLIQALFRIVEPRQGTIEIDNVDICKIGLHDLRSRLSIIPQEPTLFQGTVRGNLDPLNEYSDEAIWKALDKCQLGDLIRRCEKKLDSSVVENGENWSVGQRQLFCLGRVLLKRSNILVLDEATASVDSATDEIIQKTIRKEFGDCTVLTIAHRIHTVIDSDLILVLSDGRVQEYDTPSKLLEREDSAFSKLIKEYSMRSKGIEHLNEGKTTPNCTLALKTPAHYRLKITLVD